MPPDEIIRKAIMTRNKRITITIILVSIIYFVISERLNDIDLSTIKSIFLGVLLGFYSLRIQWITYEQFRSRGVFGNESEGDNHQLKFISIRKSRGLIQGIVFGIIFAIHTFFLHSPQADFIDYSNPFSSTIPSFFMGIVIYVFLALGGLFDIAIESKGMRGDILAACLFVLGYFVATVLAAVIFYNDTFLVSAYLSRHIFALLLSKVSSKFWRVSLVICIMINVVMLIIFSFI